MCWMCRLCMHTFDVNVYGQGVVYRLCLGTGPHILWMAVAELEKGSVESSRVLCFLSSSLFPSFSFVIASPDSSIWASPASVACVRTRCHSRSWAHLPAAILVHMPWLCSRDIHHRPHISPGRSFCLQGSVGTSNFTYYLPPPYYLSLSLSLSIYLSISFSLAVCVCVCVSFSFYQSCLLCSFVCISFSAICRLFWSPHSTYRVGRADNLAGLVEGLESRSWAEERLE
ncbi:unnamed protein product [Protopolystoma xenopodis]|uniref:Uncharacterized protein n=1 Tax=Protopolystoma xenopodis TaxID=117903 RepID=A0A3S5FCK9_9PLAT|nr:unnamed protein product [Protopolystoma xenopodis]